MRESRRDDLTTLIASQTRTTHRGLNRARSLRRGLTMLVSVALVLVVSGCGNNMFQPAGPKAESVATLGWVLIILGTAIFILTMTLLFVALTRKRPETGEAQPPGGHHPFILTLGIAMPIVVLAFTLGWTVWTLIAVGEENPDGLVIEVVGHKFWWEVRYPDHGVITANEVHIPTGEMVNVRLIPGDVLHSFWIPQLSGKMDLVPGQPNFLAFQADEPGEYRGQCSQYCGTQHANMLLLVVAQEPDEFAAWLDHQAQPAGPLADDDPLKRGEQIFLSSACVYCHNVGGTSANARVGPDLTHLASRRTIAAGMLENNPGNLAGWIIDPQSIKPGNQMPGINLSGEELQELLRYLLSLD